MSNSKINDMKFLDEFFPKGDGRRGEVLMCIAEAFLLGIEENREVKK